MKQNDWLTQQVESFFADLLQDIIEKHPEATAEEKAKLRNERILFVGGILGIMIDEVEKSASLADMRIAVISFPEVK
jgi:hypothetical protein